MGARSTDIAALYGVDIGDSVKVAATNVSARSVALTAGKRYRVQAVNLAGGATLAWVHVGDSTVTATTDAPSTPLGTAFDFIARSNRNYVAVILNAGTATLVITPVNL